MSRPGPETQESPTKTTSKLKMINLKFPKLARRHWETNGGCSESWLFSKTSWGVVIPRFELVWLVFVTTLWRCLNTTWGLVCVLCACFLFLVVALKITPVCVCVLLVVSSNCSAAFWSLLFAFLKIFFSSLPVAIFFLTSICSCFKCERGHGVTRLRSVFLHLMSTPENPNDVKAWSGKKIRHDVWRCFLWVVDLEIPLRRFIEVGLSSCFDWLQVIKWLNDWLF